MTARAFPRYPVFIPTKGRHQHSAALTIRCLLADEVPFYAVVEAEERDAYAAVAGEDRVLVLPESGQGLVYARNWIKDYSTERGDARHWQLDDNIIEFRRFYRNQRIPCHAGVGLRVCEDFVDRYENVAIAGLNYQMFGVKATKPFVTNCHVYSCVTPGTPVLCDDLVWRPVGSLGVGDGIVGFDENPLRVGEGQIGAYRYLRSGVVTSADRIVRPSYRIRFEDGREVIASDDHRWLGRLQGQARPGWVLTSDLAPGDEVKDFGAPWKTDETREAGWLAGIFDGEGYLLDAKNRRRAVCGFAQKPGLVYDEATRLLKERGFDAPGRLGESGVMNWNLAGIYDVARLLGTLRPVRMISRAQEWLDGYCIARFPTARVAEVEFVGETEVVALGTSVGTYIAEGLLSHNCTLVLNAIPHRWRLRYNDDTDMCLQVLADGWCTVLVNVFLANKLRTMVLSGGNTDDLYQGDGRLRMARSLERVWPYVVETGRRFERPQHVVRDAWRKFDTPLRLRADVDLDALPPVDEYGLRLDAVGPVRSETLRALTDPKP